MDTSEEKHMPIDVVLETSDDCGLSCNEKLHAVEIWQHPVEGIINLKIEGVEEPQEIENYTECLPQIYDAVLDYHEELEAVYDALGGDWEG